MATTYDKASLVMIPSGYKDDKLYSIKPTDGSGDFTFSRDGAGASPATRVNASGYIEKGRENVLLQSNNFGTTWVNNNTTDTGGQSGYDGSSDAWLIETTNVSNAECRMRQDSVTISTGVNSVSTYAKAGSLNVAYIQIVEGSNNIYWLVNLSTGATNYIQAGTAHIAVSSEDVGGGWYRLTGTWNAGSGTASVRIGLTNSMTSPYFTASAGENIYIQDAQLEQGLVATDYIETTTAPVSAGLLGDMPRLDYSGGATCPSLLLEPSRVNLVTQSEYFGAWGKNSVTITSNSSTSPEGVINGSLMSRSGSGDLNGSIELAGMSVASDAKVLSVYAKAETHDYIQLYHSGDAQGYVNFNLATGVVGTSGTKSTGDIEPMGNGWYRCSAIWDNTNAFGSVIFVGFASSASAPFAGGAVPQTSSVSIFGAQYETGSYSTSYIPTYGSASTRGADSCSKTGITSLIGQTEGTLFVEYNSNITEDDSFFLVADDGSADNRIVLYSNIPNNLALVISNGGVLETIIANKPLASGTNKFAVGYANNDIVLYLNGTQVGSDNTATIPATSALRMGTAHTSADYASGKGTKQAIVFPTRLTNAELAALTA